MNAHELAAGATSPEPGRRSRGRPPNPELRTAKHARMLNAALSLFLQHGYDQVTVEQVARAAGQSKGAFYWYFKDKEDCLKQIFDSLSKYLDLSILKIIEGGGSARERLRALCDFKNWTGKEMIQLTTLMNSLRHCRTDTVRSMAIQLNAQWRQNGTRLIHNLARAAAEESGWTREQLDAFDFEAWTFCYVAAYNGIQGHFERTELPAAPSAHRIAACIHESFVNRLLKPQ